jgi:hypothetical protein
LLRNEFLKAKGTYFHTATDLSGNYQFEDS